MKIYVPRAYPQTNVICIFYNGSCGLFTMEANSISHLYQPDKIIPYNVKYYLQYFKGRRRRSYILM